MAHISEYMVDPSSRTYPRSSSTEPFHQSSNETKIKTAPTEEEDKEKFIWRMNQPSDSRKYQLFPVHEKLSITPGLARKSPDSELAMSQSASMLDRPFAVGSARLKRELSLSRRRKPSISELGPMTTVQEIAMDSPTIPGRPPLHERSISAPGHSGWRRHGFGESLMSTVTGPPIDEGLETGLVLPLHHRRRSESPKSPMSPKYLSRLVIPNQVPLSGRQVTKQLAESKLRQRSDIVPDVPPKSARMLTNDKASPQTTTSTTPYTPSSSSMLNLPSAGATPISGRSSPLPALASSSTISPADHSRNTSDITVRPTHRRGESEASIMDRGRPKKREDGSAIQAKRDLAADQRAFEYLPQGIKADEACSHYDRQEIESLKRQAVHQAAKFEVLNCQDVDILSRELRALDERCEYLRKTHRSLRSGRRNLHERICTYLRSPRVAQFSQESLLKQEEALSELDQSIDDWVSKLEQAENRRTRVRQKLLEHVAAALTLDTFKTMNVRSGGDNTPPRSPTKASNSGRQRERRGYESPSPQRFTRTVTPTTMAPPPAYRAQSLSPHPPAPRNLSTPHKSPNTPFHTSSPADSTLSAFPSPPQVTLPLSLPATVFQSPPRVSSSSLTDPPPVDSNGLESQTQTTLSRSPSNAHSVSDTATIGRRSLESIRIYADSDVYALLADVQDEITRMGQVDDGEMKRRQDREVLGKGVFGAARDGMHGIRA